MNKKNLMKKKSQEVDPTAVFYAENQIDDMRILLGQHSVANGTWDWREDPLHWDNMDEKTLIKEFESVYGDDFFWGD